MVNKLWFNDTLQHAVQRPRVHHALSHDEVVVEGERNKDFPESLANILTSKKHVVTSSHDFPPSGAHALCVDENGQIEAVSDLRRGDKADGF